MTRDVRKSLEAWRAESTKEEKKLNGVGPRSIKEDRFEGIENRSRRPRNEDRSATDDWLENSLFQTIFPFSPLKKTNSAFTQSYRCIVVSPTSPVALLSETLCIGCGICVKKCPFAAIQIINLPANLTKETTHRYGENSFKLHRLPMPRPGQVLGLVGSNGTGKSTAMKILAGKLKPNLGMFTKPPEWTEILAYFRGSELQTYFTKVLQDDIKCIIKPQYVDQIPRAIKGKVLPILKAKTDRNNLEQIMKEMELNHVADRDIELLSGGELQRWAIASLAVQKADVYMFDEPSSYLDIKQRMKAAYLIRDMVDAAGPQTYVMCVEHDLSVLDYLSDYICVLYGEPGAYGVVTMPFAVRDGINIFLGGFVPTENLRFRTDALTFKVAQSGLGMGAMDDEVAAAAAAENAAEEGKERKKKGDKKAAAAAAAAAAGGEEDAEKVEPAKRGTYRYPFMTKVLKGEAHENQFKLTVQKGEFRDSEIIVMLGENGAGKTSTLRMLAGLLEPDVGPTGKIPELPKLAVSYKPQKISPKFEGTVRELLHKRISSAYVHPQFITDVVKPMKIEAIIDQEVKNLSGGELQRVALTICLGTPADLYLIDGTLLLLFCLQLPPYSPTPPSTNTFLQHRNRTQCIPRLRTTCDRRKNDQAVYFACQENGFCCGTRFYHVNVFGGSRHGFRWQTRNRNGGQVTHRFVDWDEFVFGKFERNVS